MRWLLKHTSVLHEPADALVVSAHPRLEIEGGLTADLLNRYGQAIQTELRYHLKKIGARQMEPCDVVPTFGGDTPYKAILHAVAFDAFYDSSPDWITAALAKSLELAARYEARRVAVAAVATGYAALPLIDFAAGLRPLLRRDYPPVEEVVLCVQNGEKFEELARYVPEIVE